jgi:uncharacterized phage protein (TIGR01671 family)
MVRDMRGWDYKLGRMFRVYSIHFRAGYVMLDDVDCEGGGGGVGLVREVREVDLMYGTGVRDRNGVEIFEKDIIRVFGNPFGELVVLWDFKELTWVLKRDLMGLPLLYLSLYRDKEDMLEVIGNLYEGVKKGDEFGSEKQEEGESS